MNRQALQIVAIVLLVAGLALLIYGVVSFVDFRESFAGKTTEVARGITGALVGKSNVGLSETEKKAIAFMIGGGMGVLIGGVLLFSRKKR